MKRWNCWLSTCQPSEYSGIRGNQGTIQTLITKAGDGLPGWAVQHRQPLRLGELAHDSRYVEAEPGLHSGMYIPLKTGNA